MFHFEFTDSIVWILIAVVFAIVEAFTLGLTTIWFTVGGVAACIVSLLGGPILLQVIVFLAVSIILLYFTRPLAEKKLKVGHEKNVLESLIGQTGIVTSEIKPFYTGQVKIKGQIWTAIANDGEATLEKGLEVKIIKIEGVKLIVKPNISND